MRGDSDRVWSEGLGGVQREEQAGAPGDVRGRVVSEDKKAGHHAPDNSYNRSGISLPVINIHWLRLA